MNLTVTAPAPLFQLAADILTRSIERGDWDEETCDRIAVGISAFRRAVDDDSGEAATAAVDDELADEILGILGCDVLAETTLAPFLTALDVAFDAAPGIAGS